MPRLALQVIILLFLACVLCTTMGFMYLLAWKAFQHDQLDQMCALATG